MRTIRKKNNVLASPEIVRMLPQLKGRSAAQADGVAVDLMRAGALFEIPVRSPFMTSPRFKHMPQLIRRWIRTAYGLIVFLHEKLDANRKTAYFLLLEQIWMERLREGKSGVKNVR